MFDKKDRAILTSPTSRGTSFFLRCLLIAVFVVAITLIYFFRMRAQFGLKWVLLDATWDDGRTFYNIAKNGYRGLPISEYRELGFYPFVAGLLVPLFGVYSLLVVSLASAVANALLFYFILRKWYVSDRLALTSALILSIARNPVFFAQCLKWGLPPMTICTSIQGSESIYLTMVLAGFYFFKAERYVPSFVFIGLAGITRFTGVVLATGLVTELLIRKEWRKSLLGAIPYLLLLAHFIYYWFLSGDFLAFFHGHSAFYPGSTFTYPLHDLARALHGEYRALGETALGWMIIYLYCIMGLAILWIKDRALFLVTAPTFFLFICVNNWALHARYYETLFGIPFAFILLLAKSPSARSDASGFGAVG
jgi:Gpi18-like mannosyltransferase